MPISSLPSVPLPFKATFLNRYLFHFVWSLHFIWTCTRLTELTDVHKHLFDVDGYVYHSHLVLSIYNFHSLHFYIFKLSYYITNIQKMKACWLINQLIDCGEWWHFVNSYSVSNSLHFLVTTEVPPLALVWRNERQSHISMSQFTLTHSFNTTNNFKTTADITHSQI